MLDITSDDYITFANEIKIQRSIAKKMSETEWRLKFHFIISNCKYYLENLIQEEKAWLEHLYLDYIYKFTDDLEISKKDVNTSVQKWIKLRENRKDDKYKQKKMLELFINAFPETKNHMSQFSYFTSLYKKYIFHQLKGHTYQLDIYATVELPDLNPVIKDNDSNTSISLSLTQQDKPVESIDFHLLQSTADDERSIELFTLLADKIQTTTIDTRYKKKSGRQKKQKSKEILNCTTFDSMLIPSTSESSKNK